MGSTPCGHFLPHQFSTFPRPVLFPWQVTTILTFAAIPSSVFGRMKARSRHEWLLFPALCVNLFTALFVMEARASGACCYCDLHGGAWKQVSDTDIFLGAHTFYINLFYSNGYLIIPYFSRKPIFHSAATSTSELPLNGPTISLTVWLLSCYSKPVVWCLSVQSKTTLLNWINFLVTLDKSLKMLSGLEPTCKWTMVPRSFLLRAKLAAWNYQQHSVSSQHWLVVMYKEKAGFHKGTLCVFIQLLPPW